MLQNKYYGLRHDVWGLGVLSFLLLAGKFPFTGENDSETCQQILEEEPDWNFLHERKISKTIIKLIQGMLHKDPNKRLTIRQVMNSKVFSMLDKNEGISEV